MTTKLTLLALCAVQLFAVSPPVEKPGDSVTTPRYATGLSKPSPSKEFVTAFEAGVRYGLISYIGDPTDDDIPSLTKKAKVLYFQIVVDEGKQLIADANDGTASALSERGIIITKQEAQDVVKSLEDGLNGLVTAGQFYAVAARMDQPAKDREAVINNLQEVVNRAVASRAVLETWRAKVKEAGK